MFCEICGQQIDFKDDVLIHTAAGTFPFLNNHKPKLSETDKQRVKHRKTFTIKRAIVESLRAQAKQSHEYIERIGDKFHIIDGGWDLNLVAEAVYEAVHEKPKKQEEPKQTCCDGGPQWGHDWDCPSLP